MSFMKDFEHLKIQFEDIVLATNNFDPTKMIGVGGFGSVYKGEVSSPEGLITVAFKRLDRRLVQGNIEFWKEIMMLSTYKHENLISLEHFCIEGDEMILVYEYASRGSLDRYLRDDSILSWVQRLKICVGAARGLCFLHDPKETQQRVLHRDIKSANILLDENWMAKVSDFGLSKLGPANQARTYLVSHGVGTPGYCDPLYMELGCLSKESDVYSFGVVLFEVLCGKLCYEYRNHELTEILVPKWRQCCEENRFDEIILPGLKEHMNPSSLKSFLVIAYRCVKKTREERPTMVEILKELEYSLEQQVNEATRMQDIQFGGRSLFAGLGSLFADGGDHRLKTTNNQSSLKLNCPRCDSTNTKFCYYNNYNLSQPRHYCKTCRRYWTNGGVLHDVPIGGGKRKTKRSKQNTSDGRPYSVSLISTASQNLRSDNISPETTPTEAVSTMLNLSFQPLMLTDSHQYSEIGTFRS